MADNPLKGAAEFAFGGETLTVRLTTSALIEAENESGISALRMIPHQLDRLGVLVALLRAGLKHGCAREITVDEAGEMLEADGDVVTRAIFRAVGFALPEKKGAGAAEKPSRPPRAAKGQRGTGKKS